MGHRTCIEVRGQLCGTTFLLSSLLGFLEIKFISVGLCYKHLYLMNYLNSPLSIFNLYPYFDYSPPIR